MALFFLTNRTFAATLGQSKSIGAVFPGEDAVKTVEMITKNLEYYINSTDNAVADWRARTPILKEVLRWVKCYRTVSHARRNHL